MLPQEVIRRKRNKQALSAEEIQFFIKGVTDGSIVDAQAAALTMAIFLNGMNTEETTILTQSMRDSGDVLKWTDVDGPIVDKHSSGGVGDKISLMLAPMLAACGAYVPMISGRGLGHTGGTLDKFDSIPGYQTVPTNQLFKKVVKEVGCAIIGQTGNLAPADKKIYAIRDVCASVESIELITASILSKKLAAGLDCLVMDLKCGNGAFMESIERAQSLARSIVNVANAAGCKTNAVLTDMNQVLGHSAGNAVEVQEAVDFLKGINVDSRLHIITLELCSELLVSAQICNNLKEAKNKLQRVLDTGLALEKFAQMISALGGPSDFCEKANQYLPQAPIIRPVYPQQSGFVHSMDTRGIGLSIIELKGGRTTPDQKLDYSTGYTQFCQIGQQIDTQTPLAFVHAASEEQFAKAADNLQKLITITDKAPQSFPDIIEKIS
ncbi:MAG: thymidine phosphorylase [Alphaproteobacteria bacterium]|nr:thymidine phosphorylase [Alphaproteobacteria bacterium]